MNLNIKKEEAKDFEAVFQLIESAFRNVEYSDHREQFLVERLRKSQAFIPQLSLVAKIDDRIAGHILITKININNQVDIFPSLALAPVSVDPDYQGRGIGGKLIRRSHEIAKDLGYTSIVLLGHENYYPRFGYERADKYGIELPFDVPPENCMAIELIVGGLKGVSGMVEYPEEFYQ